MGLFRHKHELETGRTSSVGMEVCVERPYSTISADSIVSRRSLALLLLASLSSLARRHQTTLTSFGERSSVGRQYLPRPLRLCPSLVRFAICSGSPRNATFYCRSGRPRALPEDNIVWIDVWSAILCYSGCWRQRRLDRDVERASCDSVSPRCSCGRLYHEGTLHLQDNQILALC